MAKRMKRIRTKECSCCSERLLVSNSDKLRRRSDDFKALASASDQVASDELPRQWVDGTRGNT